MHVTLGLQVIRAASQSKCYGGIIPRLASKSTSCTLPLVGYAVNRVGQALGQAGRGLLSVGERIEPLGVVGVTPVTVVALIEKVPILLFAEKPEHKFPLRFLLGHQFHALLAELLLFKLLLLSGQSLSIGILGTELEQLLLLLRLLAQ